MYHGKYAERPASGNRASKRRRRWIRNTALCLALFLLLGLAIGGTIAYLSSAPTSVVNDFVPANIKIDIQETVTNNVKEAVVIRNTNESNIPAYIRVALVSNWVDADGNICINHSSTPPAFTLGTDWVAIDGFYYYKKPVAVNSETIDLLGSGIELKKDNDGCSYQLEVIASAIQAQGDNDSASAISDAWKIDPETWTEVQE